MIDMASVYAERYKQNPQALQAAVMGQSPDPKLDPYTALNALKLVKESQRMAMAGQAQQPSSSPSIVAENMAPPPMMQGLGAMVPGAMGQAPQGMPQRPPTPQPTMQAASGGLAGMYTPEEDYAAGGIVAFNGEDNSYVGGELTVPPGTPYSEDETGIYVDDDADTDTATDAGTGSATDRFNSLLIKQIENMQKRRARKTNPAEQEALRAKFLERETKNAGPDIYGPEIARGAQEDADRAKRRNTGEAMALLTAAGAVLKGRSLSEGASNALPAYAGAMGEVDRADQAMKTANAKMQFALKDAQRKERMGNLRAADASMENYRKFQQDENKAEFDLNNAVANLAAKGVTGNRARAGAGGGPKYQEQILQNNVDYFRSTLKQKPNETPEAFDARVRKTASDEAAKQLKASTSSSVTDTGPNKTAAQIGALTGAQNRQLSKEMSAWDESTEAKKARKLGTYNDLYDAEFTKRQNALMSGLPTAQKVIKLD